MTKKVYLLWTAYLDKKVYVIGVLSEINDKLYSFQYTKEAIEAAKKGCFLPFPYQEGIMFFDQLPLFFEQRILKGEFNNSKFGVSNVKGNKLNYLVYGDSIKNSDNYKIVSEEKASMYL